jgi:hypothetical protein
MQYCKCNEITDDGWPTFKMRMGSPKEQHTFYLRGQDYLMKHRRSSLGEFKCSILIKEDVAK